MKYTFRRKSDITGKVRDRIIEVNESDLVRYHNGAPVQDAFPYLTPGEREFIITGITEKEWDDFIGEGDEFGDQ